MSSFKNLQLKNLNITLAAPPPCNQSPEPPISDSYWASSYREVYPTSLEIFRVDNSFLSIQQMDQLNPNDDTIIMAQDSDTGVQTLGKRFNFAGQGGLDNGYSTNLVLDEVSNMYVLTKGSTQSPQKSFTVLSKFDTTGEHVWSYDYKSVADHSMYPIDMVYSNDFVYITIFIQENGVWPFLILKIDITDGSLEDTFAVYSGVGSTKYAAFPKITADSAGDLIIAAGAIIFGLPNIYIHWIAKISPTGVLIWQKEIDLGIDNNNYYRVADVVTDVDNNIYIFGNKTLLNGVESLLIKVDTLGDVVWKQNVGSGYFSAYPRMLSVNDTSLYLLYDSVEVENDPLASIVTKLSTLTGIPEWSRRYIGTGRGGDYSYATTIAAFDEYYVYQSNSSDTIESKLTTQMIKQNINGDGVPTFNLDCIDFEFTTVGSDLIPESTVVTNGDGYIDTYTMNAVSITPNLKSDYTMSMGIVSTVDPNDFCLADPDNYLTLWETPASASSTGTVIYRPSGIDLAERTGVASNNMHDTGDWYFEFEAFETYNNYLLIQDPNDPNSINITADRQWMYGMFASCSDISFGSYLPRSISYFQTTWDGLKGVTDSFNNTSTTTANYLYPLMRVGARINLDTGDWAFNDMSGTVIASGNQPEIIGMKTLACIASPTLTQGYFLIQKIYLLESEMMAPIPPGSTAWNETP